MISSMPLRLIVDAFAFSSLLAASVGFALSFAASLALSAERPLHWALLSGFGAFIIYNLDRLRDTARDQDTSPNRTHFVERHRGRLTYAIALASVIFGGLLFTAPRPIGAICVGIGVVGFMHRRIKQAAALKTLYVSLAWTAGCVGIPWQAAGRPVAGIWLAGIILPILGANLIASNVRDNETQVLRGRPELALRMGLAAVVVALALLAMAPSELRPVAWIAGAQGLALVGFRPGERYGLLVVDGALLAGSVLASIHLAIDG